MSTYSTIEEHAAFRAVLEALSRPGTPQPLAGATEDPSDLADLVLAAVWEPDGGPEVLTGQPPAGLLARLPRGTEEQPETGATAIVITSSHDPVTEVVLSGPGVDGEMVVALPLSAAALAERAEACEVWPCGIDVLIVGPGREVRGLPRSTGVRVNA